MIHYFLLPFSFFYRIFFSIYRAYFLISNQKALRLPVISVGNISVGGTGKSLLVAFLVRHFKKPCAGILLRGYKRPHQNISLIASLGKGLLFDLSLVGDEAAMHAFLLSVPVVVGASRYASSELLASQINLEKDGYFLLDDGYQQCGIKQDCSILIMDGRALWGNGWTIPAGILREYDISRADILVVSHARNFSSKERTILKNKLIKKAKKKIPCFFAHHRIDGYFEWTFGSMIKKKKRLKGEPVAVIAGIGSFDQFIASVEQCGGKIKWKKEFPDHYQYSLEDIAEIMHALEKLPISIICTTTKDWVKLYPLLLSVNSKMRWVILDCSFSFIMHQEEIQFLKAVKNCVEMHVSSFS